MLRRARSVISVLWSYEGSFWILVTLSLMLAVWVVPFQATGQPKATIDTIAWGWWPLVVLYSLLGVSTVVCTYNRFIRDWRRATVAPAVPAVPSSDAIPLDSISIDRASELLLDAGYDVYDSASGLRAVKRSWSPLGGALFHVALIVFAIAVIVQHRTATMAEVRVIEGQSFTQASEGEPAWARQLVDGMVLRSVTPAYFEDYLLFTKLEAAVAGADGRGFQTSLSEPRWLDLGTHLSIQDYGLAPTIRILDEKGKAVTEAAVALNVFPPGAEDSIDFTPYGLRLSVVAFPDYGVMDGRDVSVTYNVSNPRFRVVVQSSKDGTLLARDLVGINEPIDAGRYRVIFTGLGRYGTFKIYRSYAVPLAALACVFLIAGLVVRLFLPRHDVLVWEHGRGVLIDGLLDAWGRDVGRSRALDVIGADER